MRRSKPCLTTVVEAQCGKQVEILLRGGKKIRGILEEMEPDMSVYLTSLRSPEESNQQNESMDFAGKELIYIRARQILFFHFLKDVAVVANTENWHRRKLSTEQTRPFRKLPITKSKDAHGSCLPE
ncbi:hypothetical protein GpartN1_g6758.t1 [Galdieria partita]|uniref:LSM domain-containing protein n=1 Tax=Galdieria partita TaxID=83374 RepID=A0A9C7Q4E6_9RHOD|nr:hypothetical protein GpartN1_g6758.t1 [Galdieria partita]